jgi:hypothetical protein
LSAYHSAYAASRLVGTARHFSKFDNHGPHPDSDPAYPVARRAADLVALWSSRKELAERYPNSVGIPLRRLNHA